MNADLKLPPEDLALVDLGHQLRRAGYQFTTITPLSHRRVFPRSHNEERTLRDIFGWSRPFRAHQLPSAIFDALRAADALDRADGTFRSTVRFSSLGDQLFVHSAFPTEQDDSVFFGPDTYRFARAILQLTSSFRIEHGSRIVDIGAGSGAGGLYAAQVLREVSPHVVLSDINAKALRFSAVNTALNNHKNIDIVQSDLYSNLSGPFDLILSNPPYLVDSRQRTYRHGGGAFGSLLSMRILEEGIDRLAPSGHLLLYTASAIIDGVDLFKQQLDEHLSPRSFRYSYDEIDPDVFGEELEHPPYDQADRIAVVAVHVRAA